MVFNAEKLQNEWREKVVNGETLQNEKIAGSCVNWGELA
jgi:hypothetical protein